MNDLHDFGIRGRLAYFISAFLNERQFRVRDRDTFSNPPKQETGVPQGSIHCEGCLPWRGMLFICRRLLYLL